MRTMSTTTLPNNCWIFEKKHYQYHGETLPRLPYVNKEYECILKDMGIPYRKTYKYIYKYLNEFTEVCEYWSTEIFEEKNLTLPLFAKMPDGSYRYCEKNYTAKVPTEETVDAAMDTEKFVRIEILKFQQNQHIMDLYYSATEKLGDDIATVCVINDFPNDIYNIENLRFLRFNNNLCYSSWVAIFDMNKVVHEDCIILRVPNYIVGAVIGKGGSNVKAWARKIGVKKIQVIPI